MRGIRVIIDLVINHTSDRHSWFQQARADEKSRFRDFYVWSKKKPPGANQGMVFPGVQKTTWTYDEKARAYYFHRFYDFQPDLDTSNPAVQEELRKVMGFWLELGVAGFRVDALPFVIQNKRPDQKGGQRYDYLRDMREFLQWRTGDAVLLAEANVTPDKDLTYFGDDGDRMHMMFNFQVNQNLFYALATTDVRPLVRALERTRLLPPTAQWAHFLRNNDELDLGRLTDAQRKRVFAAFGPDKGMQLYDRGIRRRLAPMLGGDQRRLEMAYSLMFTLPGTPVIRYGDEIGMGDDLAQPEREAARTAMQWSAAANAGFTLAERPRVAGDRGRTVRVHEGERRRSATRPGVAAELDRAHHPHAQGVPRDRLGHLARAGSARDRRAGAALRLARKRRPRRPQPGGRGARGDPGAARCSRAGPGQPAVPRQQPRRSAAGRTSWNCRPTGTRGTAWAA